MNARNIRDRGKQHMSISTEISLGEFLDKLTILEIKKSRITEPQKLKNIMREYVTLRAQWKASEYAKADIDKEMKRLKEVNERLWEIEDRIREKEARGEFDEAFIELARSVYLQNDERAAIKKEINDKLGSRLVEEKSYKEY
jgi:hypothetical protein